VPNVAFLHGIYSLKARHLIAVGQVLDVGRECCLPDYKN